MVRPARSLRLRSRSCSGHWPPISRSRPHQLRHLPGFIPGPLGQSIDAAPREHPCPARKAQTACTERRLVFIKQCYNRSVCGVSEVKHLRAQDRLERIGADARLSLSPSEFSGTWVNTNTDTPGITHV